jgi:hypothetical protein
VTWADESDVEPEFPDVTAFVRDFLAPRFCRSLETGGRVWCAQWHRHPEAVSRLTALHEAWEALHAKPVGLSTFWLQHADPTMTALMASDGPFQRCARGHTDRLPPLPTGGNPGPETARP